MLDTVLARVTATDCRRRVLIPLARAYIRYAPWAAGKRYFWKRVVNPYLAWTSYPFVASTIFGCRLAGNTQDMIQQFVYYFGVWEPNLTAWVQRRLTPGDTFIDVGANVGYFSLLAAKLVTDTGTVVAIEASPKIFSILQQNLARNRAHQVRAVNVAVSDRKGLIKLFRGPDYNLGMTAVFDDPGRAVECDVEAVPLGDLLTPAEVQKARLIKIDVEGAEWSVVTGMRPLLSACRSDLEVMVEINPERLAQQGKQPADLLRIFSEAGFHAYRIENDYWALSHLAPRLEKRPVRLQTPIQYETDVVFSRQDAELL